MAEAAGVSRATAYRYFPTQEALEVELRGTAPLADRVDEALAALTDEDADERLLLVLDTFNPLMIAEQATMRTALRVYQDTWLRSRRAGRDDPPPVRQGRRMRWLDTVLEGVDLPDEQRRRLQAALALTIGGDSISIMKDVCHLDDEEALTVLRWAATALLEAGISGARAPRAAARRSAGRRAPGRRAQRRR